MSLAASSILPLAENSQGELLIPPKGLILVTHEPNIVSTTPGPHIRGNTLRALSAGDKEVDLFLPGTGRYLLLIQIFSLYINLSSSFFPCL